MNINPVDKSRNRSICILDLMNSMMVKPPHLKSKKLAGFLYFYFLVLVLFFGHMAMAMKAQSPNRWTCQGIPTGFF